MQKFKVGDSFFRKHGGAECITVQIDGKYAIWCVENNSCDYIASSQEKLVERLKEKYVVPSNVDEATYWPSPTDELIEACETLERNFNGGGNEQYKVAPFVHRIREVLTQCRQPIRQSETSYLFVDVSASMSLHARDIMSKLYDFWVRQRHKVYFFDEEINPLRPFVGPTDIGCIVDFLRDKRNVGEVIVLSDGNFDGYRLRHYNYELVRP
jgi:hypothetical protein